MSLRAVELGVQRGIRLRRIGGGSGVSPDFLLYPPLQQERGRG